MKVLTEKLDYQLYEEMFVNKDLSKVRELWKAICKNPVFLSEAMEIDKIANSSVLSFRAPMICFMMLRLPASVPEYFYSNLVDLVIRRQDVASSIDIHGTYIDFLSLVLGNCNLKLEDYQKDKIMDLISSNYGFEENKLSVNYTELLAMESPVVARLHAKDLDVSVSEYEYEAFFNGEVKSADVTRRYKTASDYRTNALKNTSFSEFDRDMILTRINQDEFEFYQFINYLLKQLAFKGTNDLSLEYIIVTSKEDLKVKFANDSDTLDEVLVIKGLVDKHYQEENTLLRRVN